MNNNIKIKNMNEEEFKNYMDSNIQSWLDVWETGDIAKNMSKSEMKALQLGLTIGFRRATQNGKAVPITS